MLPAAHEKEFPANFKTNGGTHTVPIQRIGHTASIADAVSDRHSQWSEAVQWRLIDAPSPPWQMYKAKVDLTGKPFFPGPVYV